MPASEGHIRVVRPPLLRTLLVRAVDYATAIVRAIVLRVCVIDDERIREGVEYQKFSAQHQIFYMGGYSVAVSLPSHLRQYI